MNSLMEIPFPFKRKILPLWVPAGILILALPSIVGTSNLSSEHGISKRNMQIECNVQTITLQIGMRFFFN